MTDLEERLRAAFDARAQTFETSPDAWLRVRERRPRRYRAARLLVAALPVALLAVFVPALLNGDLGRNTAADADAIHQGLMRDRTAVGEQVTVDNPTEGRPLRLWFAKGRLGDPELCYVLERADAEAYGAARASPRSAPTPGSRAAPPATVPAPRWTGAWRSTTSGPSPGSRATGSGSLDGCGGPQEPRTGSGP
ncbi:hypothetical protein ACFQ0B_30010 [Nonomuraea thailandensis]